MKVQASTTMPLQVLGPNAVIRKNVVTAEAKQILFEALRGQYNFTNRKVSLLRSV